MKKFGQLEAVEQPLEAPFQSIEPSFISLFELLHRVSEKGYSMEEVARGVRQLRVAAEGSPEWLVCSKVTGLSKASETQRRWAEDRLQFVEGRGNFESDAGMGASTDYYLFGFDRAEIALALAPAIEESTDFLEALAAHPTDRPTVTTKASLSRPVRGDKPWLVVDERDLALETAQPWYTPARYFARELVKADSTLAANRSRLAKKVADELFAHGFRKRGGKLGFDPGTIMKALSNVQLT